MRYLIAILVLSACTAAPLPDVTYTTHQDGSISSHVSYDANEGWLNSTPEKWPNDGWKPPPMHTATQIREIRKHNHHISEFINIQTK